MSKSQGKNRPTRTSWANILPNNIARRSTIDKQTCTSAPSSTNVGRRKNNHRASLGAMIRSEINPVNIIPRDCVAWQTISQQLTLQLEEKYRSQLVAHRRRSILSSEERNDHITVLIDEANDSKMSSTIVEGESEFPSLNF
jgi:hypothetical protein